VTGEESWPGNDVVQGDVPGTNLRLGRFGQYNEGGRSGLVKAKGDGQIYIQGKGTTLKGASVGVRHCLEGSGEESRFTDKGQRYHSAQARWVLRKKIRSFVLKEGVESRRSLGKERGLEYSGRIGNRGVGAI